MSSPAQAPRRGVLWLVTVLALALLPGPGQAVTLSFDGFLDRDQARGTSALCTGACVVLSQRAVFGSVAPDFDPTIRALVQVEVKAGTSFGGVTAPGGSDGTNTPGLLPDYTNDGGGPEDDLGLLFFGDNAATGETGVSVTVSFFRRQNGTRVAATLPEIEIAVYDVDGEASQDEFFRAFAADGLVGYRLTSDAALTPRYDSLSETVLFEGGGEDVAETDASGAALLRYANVNRFTIDYGSRQSGGTGSNGVFFAIDGDLSLFGGVDLTDPVPPTGPPVPLPPGGVLILSAIAGLVLLRRRADREAS